MMTGIINRSLLAAGVIVSITVYAQQYTFDYLIVRRGRAVPEKFELAPAAKKSDMRKMRNSHLINSKNSDYQLFMTFDAYPYDHKSQTFMDVTDKLNHSFRTYPVLLEKEVGFRLRHERLVDNDLTEFITVRKMKDMQYEITADTTGSGKVIITVLLRESTDDLTGGVVLEIPAPMLATMISELKRHLNPDKTYFISEYTSQRVSGPKVHVRMEAVKLTRPLVVHVNPKMIKED